MNFKDWIRTSITLHLTYTPKSRVLDEVCLQPEATRHNVTAIRPQGYRRQFWYEDTFSVFRGFPIGSLFIVRNLRKHRINDYTELLPNDTIRWVSKQ